MARLLKGKEAADQLSLTIGEKLEKLRERGVDPTLAILRLGEDPGDLSYERGALKRAEALGIQVRKKVCPADIPQERLLAEIQALNEDEAVHGVLLFRPLPKHLDDEAVCSALEPAKDMDGITAGSLAGVFTGRETGYPPCTAEACMVLLAHYGVELAGKQVTILGRSLVIGRPAAMMAMEKNATVTICHSKTRPEDLKAAGQRADVLIAALGRAEIITGDLLGDGQIILDVGINVDEEGRLCGDVNFAEAEPKAAGITPVPGGVGSVTTAVLMKHVVEAAEKAAQRAGR